MFGKKKEIPEIPSAVRPGASVPDDKVLFFENRRTIRQLCAPEGVNPNPLDYMLISDGGREIYTLCFYIDKLPTRTTFAQSFAELLNYPDVTSCIFIDPLVDGQSNKKLNRRINMLGTEQAEAAKGDRNRYRQITQKLHRTEGVALDVESGDNMLYEVAFLFVLQSLSLDGLHMMANDFHSKGKTKGIELSACYSVHPEAFLSGYPFNRIVRAESGLLHSSVFKKHTFDKQSLSDIFNHTQGGFGNPEGIIAGHNMYTGYPYTFDPYDSSHDGYGVVFAGKTHSGKSATVKMYLSRLIDFDYKVRSIDFDSTGAKGEYVNACKAVGGVNFQLRADSDMVLNLFEIDVEMDYDEQTDTEYPALHLAEKKSNTKNLIMTMLKNGREMDKFSEVVFIESIIEDVVDKLYAQRGITDEPDSLYEPGKVFEGGVLVDGMVRKELPVITDFYYELLCEQRENKDPMYDTAYAVIVRGMKKYVRELSYCPHCMKRFNGLQEGEKCPECQNEIAVVKGTKPYFDGQSSIHADAETTWINFDISQLPKADKVVALLVCMEYIQENYVKKNSANPKKAKKMVFEVDESHETFPYPEAVLYLSNAYRENRKRHVSTWTTSQALADYNRSEETKAIIKNTACIFLLKQAIQDRAFLKEVTPLTDAQIDGVFNLGDEDEITNEKRRGEVCVIDGKKSQFIKVDYLTSTEALIVETDVEQMKKLYKGKVGEAFAEG